MAVEVWSIIFAVELTVSILLLFVILYFAFTGYKHLTEKKTFNIYTLLLYPCFWQALAATFALVYQTLSFLDVWFILHIFFEIMASAFTIVYLNKILEGYFIRHDFNYIVVNYFIYLILAAALIISLIGLIQIRMTFVYYEAGSVLFTAAAAIVEVVIFLTALKSPHKKFFALLLIGSTFMTANGVYYMYLAFENFPIVQNAKYPFYIVLNLLAKVLNVALGHVLIGDLPKFDPKPKKKEESK